jgi:tRNA threonylcarbamoyladenosine biosynthesis protein TsaE
MIAVTSKSRRQTLEIASVIAQSLRGGDVVVLTGELGGGKTAFVAGAAEALGCTEPVSSPTFAIVQLYEGATPIAHADVYRLTSSHELFDIGFEEVFDGTHVVFVEWGDRALDVLPDAHLRVSMVHRDEVDEREVCLTGCGSLWQQRLIDLAPELQRFDDYRTLPDLL